MEQIADKGRGFAYMELTNGMLDVRLDDRSYVLFFLDERENQFPYLAEKIYPSLSSQDRQRLGLGQK